MLAIRTLFHSVQVSFGIIALSAFSGGFYLWDYRWFILAVITLFFSFHYYVLGAKYQEAYFKDTKHIIESDIYSKLDRKGKRKLERRIKKWLEKGGKN